ncbi:unnamed protein product [Ambrosiozyma monospora]|uniref:Unnamed protein product n=1 Tax=Ambrosiozyma monospora TaxID=43982 RepID=A0ACB5UDD9_AMBMO|nr:unnamed protein product [Ambrosiozyma monospora]
MDPFQIVEKRFTFDLEGNKIRNLGEEFGSFNFDLEGFIWNVINHYVCEEKIEFKYFEFANWGMLCDSFMGEQLQFLQSSAEKIFAGQTLGQWERLNQNNQE